METFFFFFLFHMRILHAVEASVIFLWPEDTSPEFHLEQIQ